MQIVYDNNILKLSDSEREDLFTIGDNITLSLKSTYSTSGIILDIVHEKNTLIIQDSNSQVYVGFNAIKDWAC
ncbi:hypothetical protein [Clostridium baratii]|uniref:hypothetical protein n=1 Tax=Clostridium baratii TaxID=1561 RepID=UPI0005F2B9A2|nr:hypothetical protein [Clostridium baratii]AQM58536.1 hypothetical protein NPD11_3061 [Clostridium baratii]KJU70927.1 hypothetical protein UC77_12205 [Clostridium baratii]